MAGQKPTDFDVRLGERLRSHRTFAKATQRQIAGEIGISAAQLQKYEKGTNAMSARDVQTVARFLNLPVVAFYDPPAADYGASPVVPGIDPERAAQIRDLITKVAEMIAPAGPAPWEPLPGARVRCSGGVGRVVGIDRVRKMAGVRFDDAPESGLEPRWAFAELSPEPEPAQPAPAAQEPLARLLYDLNAPILLEGDRIVIDVGAGGSPELAGELHKALSGATAIAVVRRAEREA